MHHMLTPNPAYRHQHLQTNTQSNSPEQHIYQTPTDLNQSEVDLLSHQTDLAHNMQHLHQQIMDALPNIAKSSALQRTYISLMTSQYLKLKTINHLMNGWTKLIRS